MPTNALCMIQRKRRLESDQPPHLVDIFFLVNGVEYLHEVALSKLSLTDAATPTTRATTRWGFRCMRERYASETENSSRSITQNYARVTISYQRASVLARHYTLSGPERRHQATHLAKTAACSMPHSISTWRHNRAATDGNEVACVPNFEHGI